MRKIRESLEEVGDNCRLEFNPDFPKFLCDLLPRERNSIYLVETSSSQEGLLGQTSTEVKLNRPRPCLNFKGTFVVLAPLEYFLAVIGMYIM